MNEIQPFVQNYDIFRCPTAPDIKDGYSGLNLGYGINVFNFLNDNSTCFWYCVSDLTIKNPKHDLIWVADCQAQNAGCFWVGSGSVFKEPVPYVDYRHDNGFCAVLRRPLRVADAHDPESMGDHSPLLRIQIE